MEMKKSTQESGYLWGVKKDSAIGRAIQGVQLQLYVLFPLENLKLIWHDIKIVSEGKEKARRMVTDTCRRLKLLG